MKINTKNIRLIFVVLGLMACFYGFFIEPNFLIVKKIKIEDETLKGLKIVFASDFHFRKNQQKRLEKTVNLINQQNPDIVLSVGDFVNGQRDENTMSVEKIASGLSRAKGRYGFYTTLGNHDTVYNEQKVQKALENNGIKVLDNENVKIIIDGKSLYIAGVEDFATRYPDINKALNDTKAPVIFLTHSPDLFVDIPAGVNLILSGHLHGGQIRIPFFGAVWTPSGYGDKYSKGKIIEENGKKMIVTRGIGTSFIHMRIFCPPEIVVIEFT